MAGILVLGEVADGQVQSATGELLVAGHKLGDKLGEEVAVAFLGTDLGGASGEAVAHGADRVYVAEDPHLAEYQVDLHVSAFEQICKQTAPSVVLLARSPAGSDIGPRLAFRLGAGLAQDCVDLDVDAETRRVVATRPVYGGNALAKFTFPGDGAQVVVVRRKVYEPVEGDPTRQGEVVAVAVDLDPSMAKSRLVETVVAETEGVRLEDAPIVVGGGRGMGGSEPFTILEELAQLLHGAIGGSRAVCDAGWLDHNYQIGLTGKTISPNLYIMVGISGASQHMAGCSGAKHIVAINRDADANIFKAAGFGVVGDWNKVLPSFLETVRELVKS